MQQVYVYFIKYFVKNFILMDLTGFDHAKFPYSTTFEFFVRMSLIYKKRYF